MNFNQPFVRYLTASIFLIGVFLGIINIYQNLQEDKASNDPVDVKAGKEPFVTEETPDPVPEQSMNRNREIENSEPLEIGPIISGVQPENPVPKTKTEDQRRLERNVLRDFGQFLDPEIRDPDSPGNQRGKREMVRMLVERTSDTAAR